MKKPHNAPIPDPFEHAEETLDPDDFEGLETQAASKTARKKAMLALQDLGTELVALSSDALKQMDLPDELLTALLDAKRFKQHGAHRRQLQYIGRLMRDLDTAPIAGRLARLKGESSAAKAEFHALERWRTRLLEDDQALALWLNDHPGSDAQQLRQLIRNARKEAAESKPPKSSRQLFRLLRDALTES